MTDTPIVLSDPNDVRIIEGHDVHEILSHVPKGAVPSENEPPADTLPAFGTFDTPDGVLIVPAWSTVDVSEPGVQLRYGPMTFTAAQALELFTNAGIPANNPLPMMEDQILGYKRGASEDVINVLGEMQTLPVLAQIGTIQALPDIKDPVVHRVFDDYMRAGPRLIAAVVGGKGIPATARVYVAEFPPCTILTRSQDKYYTLKLPFLILCYIPTYGTVFIRARTAPITANDTELKVFPFPHIDGAGLVCIGKIDVKDLDKREPLAACVGAMTTYLHNGYTYYTGPNLHTLLPKLNTPGPPQHGHGIDVQKHFAQWEKMTLDEILGLPWQNAGNLDTFLEQCTGRASRRTGNEGGGRYPVHYYVNDEQIARADAVAHADDAQTE